MGFDRSPISFCCPHKLHLTISGTSVLVVAYNLGSTIVVHVTFGCQTTKSHTTVLIVDFVVLVGQRTFNIVMIVGCASTRACTLTTTARAASTSPIALFARSIFLVQEVRRMKCLAVMQSTGSAFDNLQHMTRDVQFAKRLQKRGKG